MINNLTENVRLILYGHVHENYNNIDHVSYCSAPSTAFQFQADGANNNFYGYKEYFLENKKVSFKSIWMPIEGV